MKAKEIRTILLTADERPLHEVVNAWLDEDADREIVEMRVLDHAGQEQPSLFVVYRTKKSGGRTVGFALGHQP